MDSRPIGIFDSGIGGLTVLRALRKELPGEPFTYFADSARLPYGPRPETEIKLFSHQITQFLVDRGAKIIVVACNTATGAAIGQLRHDFSTPFIGLEPAIKPAAARTRTGVIGILATEGTFRGRHFLQTRQAHAGRCEIRMQVGHGLVEQVESGDLTSAQARALTASFLRPLIDQNADQIVLGCTHYPFLLPLMEEIANGAADLIDPAPAVALQTRRVLEQNGLQASRMVDKVEFFTTGNPETLRQQIAFLTPEMLASPRACAQHRF